MFVNLSASIRRSILTASNRRSVVWRQQAVKPAGFRLPAARRTKREKTGDIGAFPAVAMGRWLLRDGAAEAILGLQATNRGKRRAMRLPAVIMAAICCLLSSVAAQGQAVPAGSLPPIPSLYHRDDDFRAAIAAAEALDLPHRRVSGMAVAHHLVAADLIARAFAVAAANRYDKIILFSPDHFKRSIRPFATTRRSFETVFGPVPASLDDIDRLLARSSLVEESDLFVREHGIAAILPFIRHFFPGTPIVPITVAIGSNRKQWDQFIDDIGPLITPRTLIVQSTDFSHYLPFADAIRHDQQVLNVISSGDLDAVARLRQPSHLDSRGAQYIQMRLQQLHFGARPTVIANSNLQLYAKNEVTSTTSYVIQLYLAPDDAAAVDDAGYVDGHMLCFAGDTFFGRYMAPLVSRPQVRERLLAAIRAKLKGCPLVVNLEGVTSPELPTGLGPKTLAMPEKLTIDWLKALNVVAVSLANNHSGDLGEEAQSAMVDALRQAGIATIGPGQTVDLGPARVVGLTDLDNNAVPHTGLVTDAVLDGVMRSQARPPLIAFMHWGQEYNASPGSRETALADALHSAAVSLIVGAHPHVASEHVVALAGGDTALAYSLGNFIFDQPGKHSSSAVLEVRFFPQGTFFARLLPMPNFYDKALAAR